MIQDKVKGQIDQFKKQSDNLQAQLNKSLSAAKAEGQRILKEMGVESGAEKINLQELLAELRQANPTVRDFIRNLEVATYDNRFRLNWNTTMISAYARQQAEKAYAKDIKPRISEARSSLMDQLHDVRNRTQEIRAKISA